MTSRAWALLALTLCLASLALLRLYLILSTHRQRSPRKHTTENAHLMILLGSGGHTTEMLLGLRFLDTARYNRRTWVVGFDDGFSREKVAVFEEGLLQKALARVKGDTEAREAQLREVYGSYAVATVPRARYVHQPLVTTPFTAVKCFWACVRLLVYGVEDRARQSPTTDTGKQPPCSCPNVIVTNGPGSAVILILASLLLRFLDLPGWMYNDPSRLRTVYFESWARVTGLSLSGRLLERLVDRFVVQWPQLRGKGREYGGWLVVDQRVNE